MAALADDGGGNGVERAVPAKGGREAAWRWPALCGYAIYSGDALLELCC